MKDLSLTTTNINHCSGGCLYCLAASTINYSLIKTNDAKDIIIKDCIRVDNKTYDEAQFDFEALEKKLDELRPDSIALWGGDPITSFKCLQEEVDFLEWWSNKNNHPLHITSSTNGLPLLRDDIKNYLIKHNLNTQLSHDGVGQWIRTGNIDPLDFDNVKELVDRGIINSINATLSFYNYSCKDNIDYFHSKLKEIWPDIYNPNKMASERESNLYRSLYIKLNHIMDSDYNVTGLNKDGRWQNTTIEALKNTKLGDMSLRNGVNEWDKHVLDDYIADWFELLWQYGDNRLAIPYFLPFRKYIISQFQRGRKLSSFNAKEGNPCRLYQMGLTDNSIHIDTLGRFTQCNLLDSNTSVVNPTNERPNCKGCRYELSSECNMCGAVKPREDCQYFFRWNQFLDQARRVYYGLNNNKS